MNSNNSSDNPYAPGAWHHAIFPALVSLAACLILESLLRSFLGGGSYKLEGLLMAVWMVPPYFVRVPFWAYLGLLVGIALALFTGLALWG
jgi:hypothetical protein